MTMYELYMCVCVCVCVCVCTYMDSKFQVKERFERSTTNDSITLPAIEVHI